MNNLNSLYCQIKEVKEVNTEYECNKLLETGEWILLNTYRTSRLIASEEYSQEFYYCLGRIR